MINVVVILLAIFNLILFKKYIDLVNIIDDLNENMSDYESSFEELIYRVNAFENSKKEENKKELLFEENKNNE